MLKLLRSIRKFSTNLERVEATVFDVVRSFDKVVPSLVDRNSRFEDLGLDSLDTIEVVVELEERFKIDLSDQEVLKVHSVMDAINTFQKHVT
mmetsp:Transcript_6765/g.9975  ORF Transcript_6765/g.9975 Transcript_6765/m.9975 type:complete len:92 (+) Transcript_6765:3067-3342(+)